MAQQQRLAVGKTVRVGDLARVWDGKRWRDGLVRSVGYAATLAQGCEVEIKYEGCGCEFVQRGQCRHRFHESDCGRLWLRDCPALRRQRRQAATAAAATDASTTSTSSSSATSASTATRPAWPTAKYHQHLKRKKRPEDEAIIHVERPRDLPFRKELLGGDEGYPMQPRKKFGLVGRRLPKWRCKGREEERPSLDLHDSSSEKDYASPQGQAFTNAFASEPAPEPEPAARVEPPAVSSEAMSAHASNDREEEEAHDHESEVCDRTAKPGVGREAAPEEKTTLLGRQHSHEQQQQQEEDSRQQKRKGKNKRRKEMLRKMSKMREGNETVAVESGGARVVSLEAYEWVRVEGRGVLWVEEGPARLVLRSGERIVSGPHRRLDLPTTSAAAACPSSFFFGASANDACVA